MSKIKYIGRTTDFCGKTLWEILGNLKNYGVGRVVVRSMFERYPEKTFYRIIKTETLATPVTENMDNVRKIKVWAQKVFRGREFELPVVIESASYKTDYKLLSKKDEKDYCQVLTKNTDDVKIIANEMEVPPLLRELILRQTGNSDTKMKLKIKKCYNKNYRLAKEGEKPTMELSINIGKPLSPSLFKGLDL